MPTKKQRIFSGVQPSGNLHLGNFLGAIAQWVELQEDYDCIYCVVDYHAITTPQDPDTLRKKVIEIARIYLASGIDPARSIVFPQSAVSAHTELGWILNTIARMSELRKMTQFKDKAGDDQENVPVGLFDYPVLMAADILLYDAAVVPVGDDQLQHVELTRDIARRFNHRFGPTLVEPAAKILEQGARIMGLDDPAKKMSKSAKSEYNRIELLDAPDAAARKIMRAATDSGREVIYDPKTKPGVANLLAIYSLLAGKSIKSLEKDYRDSGYGELKKDLAEVVRGFLASFQDNYNSLSDQAVKNTLEVGAERARKIADATLRRVKERIGVL